MDIIYNEQTIGFLDITFGPSWEYVALTRSYIENFLAINAVDKLHIGKIQLAASELLENAVKYCSREGNRIILNKNDKEKEISIRVFNFIEEEKAKKVVNQVKEMNRADPMEYYIQCMHNLEGGLGFARMNYETDAKISCEYSTEKNILEVKALFLLS